jgi:RNA polymerase sigma factor (sigma-70 family)
VIDPHACTHPTAVLPYSSSEPAGSPLLTLTAGLARGDDVAWLEFHRDHGPGIFRYLLAGTRGDYDLAAEALQQTYLRIARYSRPFDSAPIFAGWLRTLASSALNDCRRRRKSFWNRLHNSDVAAEEYPREASARDETLSAALDAALAQLDPAERDLLTAKYFLGADVRSLALKLGLTSKAVESRLTRARAELRRHLTAALSSHD